MHDRVLRLPALLLALALVAGACSGDDDPASTTLPSVETEVVEFRTTDGVLLEGTIYGEGADGIVLAHMRSADRSTWEPFAEVAAGNGFRVLTFDFRGYGDSEGERDTLLDVDLTAAIEHLERNGVENVVVMGASMGGTAAINVASELDLAGIVSLSAPAAFQGLSALDVASNVEEPAMFIAAADDQPYADDATAMAAAAADTRRLNIVDGRAHGTILFADYPDDMNGWLLGFAGDPAGYS
jgi:pimeloyl-ACP methyl ester carboxylesterase